MSVSILVLVFSFSSFFPAYANASLDYGRHSAIIKAQASSQTSLNIITEAESFEEDKTDYINYNITSFFLFPNVEVYWAPLF